MLKLMRDDDEWTDVFAEEVGENTYEYKDANGVRRQLYFDEDDDGLVFGNAPVRKRSHDDLDELDGVVPELDRTLEEGQLALERLQNERGRALREDHLALYLALDTKVAQLSGYLQGLSFVRDHMSNDPPGHGLLAEGGDRVSLGDSAEAQATLNAIVRRIEDLLKRRAEQKNLN